MTLKGDATRTRSARPRSLGRCPGADRLAQDEPSSPGRTPRRRPTPPIAALRERGSPSHDGLGARLASYAVNGAGLRLELQPARWALRLAPDARDSMTVLCVVRGADGRWLAGRRADWVASWAGRWALGAGGSVEVNEDPVTTLSRELEEEWSVAPSAAHGGGAGAAAQRPGVAHRARAPAQRRRGRTRRRARRLRLVAGRPARRGPRRPTRPLRRVGTLLESACAPPREPTALGGLLTFKRLEICLVLPLGHLPGAAGRLARPGPARRRDGPRLVPRDRLDRHVDPLP